MRILILTLLALFNFSNTTNIHDAVIANFNIIEKGHVLMLEIDFDTHDFLKCSNHKDQKITKENFNSYLNATTSWKIDDAKLTPNVLSIKSAGDHTKVVCFLAKSFTKNVKSISIKNEFLVDIDSHVNVITVDINKKHRSFKMDKKRKKLVIDY